MSIEERLYSEAFEDGFNYAIQRMFNVEGGHELIHSKQDLAKRELLRKYKENAALATKKTAASVPVASGKLMKRFLR